MLVQVLPLAVARCNDFAKGDTPFSGRRFYLLSGGFNVLLYWYTRPYLLPHRVERQSMVLDAERANSQNHLTSSGFVGSVMEIKPADPVYEAPEITHHQNGTYQTSPLTASPIRDEIHIRDVSTGVGATNMEYNI